MRRLLITAIAGALVLLNSGPAAAVFGTTGTGTGVAAVSTMARPTAVAISSLATTVTVNWTAPTPPAGTRPDGYYVTRDHGSGPVAACGTVAGSPGTYLAGTATSCTDGGVPIGSVTYSVTAVWRTWTATSTPSNSISVVADGAGPSLTIAMTAPGNASFTGNRVYFRPTVAGSFRLAGTLTDTGSGPDSVTFPAIGATGWTHAAETVTSGTGSPPTITYTSSPYSWTALPATPTTQPLTGRDVAGNTVTTPIAFAADATGPAGGSLTANAVAAAAGGSTSYNRTGSFSLTRVDFSETVSLTQSGIATSVLTRSSATLSNGSCGSFGAPTTLTGAPAQTGLGSGCYRYMLAGTDAVGNVSVLTTTVVVDPTAPTQSFALTSATGAVLVGTNIWVRSSQPGSFLVSSTVTDAQSGPASATFPAIPTTGWTHPAETVTNGTGSPPTITYTSSAFSWISGVGNPGRRSFVGRDLAGNAVTTQLRLRADNNGPTGGALTVNGTAATSGGSLSTTASGTWTISRTDYNADGAAGFATSVLTVATAPYSGGTCGAFGTATVIAGSPAQSGPAATCFRYQLTGTDRVGNTSSLITTVRRAP